LPGAEVADERRPGLDNERFGCTAALVLGLRVESGGREDVGDCGFAALAFFDRRAFAFAALVRWKVSWFKANASLGNDLRTRFPFRS
jgi:hypothetical protein